MKISFMKPLAFVAMAAVAMVATSCGTEETEEEFNDAEQLEIINQFVDQTVAPTYSALAANTESLVELLKELKDNPTDSKVQAACDKFLAARAEWERSEAFLFGAASAFGIDPHIDSWPLDLDAFDNIINSPNMLTPLAEEDGDEAAYNTLSNSNLGFHGLEYVLFRDGQPRAASQISDKELIYAVAVAGDLRNNCYRLEVGWLGDDAPSAHIEKLDDLEWAYTIDGSDYSYGENMKRAGKAGSTYASTTLALMSIIQGCADIADEVGSSKINSAYALGDESYIESPYSQMSITDFYNNIISIRNVYMGGVEDHRNESRSLHAYIKDINSQVDADIMDAIDNALTKIQEMKAPFVNNIHDASNGVAVDACNELSEVLSGAIDVLK